MISEIHYHPASSQGELLEFVELYNASTESVDIGGWRLDGARDHRWWIPHRRASILQSDGGFPHIQHRATDYRRTGGRG